MLFKALKRVAFRDWLYWTLMATSVVLSSGSYSLPKVLVVLMAVVGILLEAAIEKRNDEIDALKEENSQLKIEIARLKGD